MIKACIFDLDGTLADTLESMAYVANEIMQKYGLKTLPTDNFRYYSGEGADMLMQRALKDAGDKELIHYEEGRRLYREMFAADPMYKVVPYEGMPETLKELKKRGIRLAVCSNKPHPAAVKVIAQLYGDDFDMVLGQSDAIRRKPAPDGPAYDSREIWSQTGRMHVCRGYKHRHEDRKAAGMFTVGALWGFRDREELNANGADLVAEHPTDLVKISEEYCND